MFFPASKIVFFAITPSNFGILLGLGGLALALLTHRARLGACLALAGLLVLAAGGFSPLPALALLPLEQRFPQFPEDGGPIAGIVVLGGGVESDLSHARGQVIVNDAGERPIYLADLARRFPTARIVFSGGSGTLTEEPVAEADIVSRHADTLGLPRTRMILENRSRNTRENALFTAGLVQPKPGERWLLVTSAWHMPRAVGCFRRAGFTVAAFPVDYRTRGPVDALRANGRASEGLFALDLAAKEWVGLVAYKLAGYTDDWLPAPEPEPEPEPSPSPSSATVGSASR